jgi:hypothetical protein
MAISLVELKNRIATYRELLKDSNYVGEICLAEEELNNFAIGLAKYRRDLGENNYSTGILILSVNIAYYYYDDNGFWTHFYEITQFDDNRMIGQLIESSLQKLNLLKVKRHGPFRYVGAILEQCGVSKRYIPSFVFVLKEINRRYGRSTELEYSKIITLMRDIHCSKYLKDFLLDEEGIFFTMQVLKNIKMFEGGFLNVNDLANLSGFRPGFWDEILKHFKVNKSKDFNIKSFELPQIKLNIQKCSLELVFPSKELFKSMENNYMYSYPVTPISIPQMLQDYFKGEIVKSNRNIYWESPGWNPDIYPILFDISNRTMIPKSHIITPKSYYLLAPASFKISKDINIKFLGELACHLKEVFCVYEVKINIGDTIPGLKITSEKSQQVTVHFRNPEDKLFELHQGLIDVFLGELPELCVSDFSLIEKNEVGLFYDFGKVRGRIKSKNELKQLSTKVKQNEPFKGRIWVETLVRNNNITTNMNSELFFYVIPCFNIIGKERCFGLSETPQLIIDNNDEINIKIKDSIINNNTYILPAETKVVYGEIIFGNHAIEFQFPLIRIGLLDEKGRVIRYLETSEIGKESTFILYGPRNSEVQLHFSNGDVITKTFLNDKGSAILKGNQLIGSYTNDFEIIPLKALINNEEYLLGTILIDTDRLFENYKKIDFIPDQKINKVLNVIDRLIDNHSNESMRLNNRPSVTKKFDEKVLSYIYCSQILDGKIIKIDEQKVNWEQFIKSNPLLDKILNAYKTKDWNQSLNDFRNIIPRVKRWTDAIERHIKIYSPNNNLEFLKEWSDEIRGTVINLRSSLTLQEGGRSLSHAWISYNKNNINEVLKRLNDIPKNSTDIVFDLMEYLKIILFIRQARFKQAEKLTRYQWKTQPFDEIRRIFEALIMRINGEISPNESMLSITQETKSIIDILPLRLEDFRLIKFYILFLDTRELFEDFINKDDWLSCWLVLNLFKNNQEIEKEIVAVLTSLKVNIPSSMERENILESINNTLRKV